MKHESCQYLRETGGRCRRPSCGEARAYRHYELRIPFSAWFAICRRHAWEFAIDCAATDVALVVNEWGNGREHK